MSNLDRENRLFEEEDNMARGVYPDKQPLCPECRHPVSAHGKDGCYEWGYETYCRCHRSPADLQEKPQIKFRCLHCGRDTFSKPNQPHICNGIFRKHKQQFEVILQNEPTCPECECPISKHDSDGCHELLGGLAINDRCDCKLTHADLQPKHCTKPGVENIGNCIQH